MRLLFPHSHLSNQTLSSVQHGKETSFPDSNGMVKIFSSVLQEAERDLFSAGDSHCIFISNVLQPFENDYEREYHFILPKASAIFQISQHISHSPFFHLLNYLVERKCCGHSIYYTFSHALI